MNHGNEHGKTRRDGGMARGDVTLPVADVAGY
jgi:hypothetical protein